MSDASDLPRGYPKECERTARTRDGLEYRIRPIRPDDLEREYEFVRGLSEETLYNRLMHAVHEPSDALLRPLVNVDYHSHMALVALSADSGRERIVGVARYAVAADGDHEFAIAVADAMQGRGIGTTLLHDLFEYASRRGLRRLSGTVLPGNDRMIRLARSLGLTIGTYRADPSLLTVSLVVPPPTDPQGR
jgi:acetyltransferase